MSEDHHNKVNDNLGQYGKPLSFEDVWRMFQETDKQFRETDKQFKETDKKIKQAFDLFTSQWGRLVESLVEGDLLHILRERNILVENTHQRVKGSHQGKNYEFDIIAVNGRHVVVVEVKTSLHPDDVRHFLEKLKNVRLWLKEYADKEIFGAVAYLQADAGSARMAQNQGLLAIRATGKSAWIINPQGFVPKSF